MLKEFTSLQRLETGNKRSTARGFFIKHTHTIRKKIFHIILKGPPALGVNIKKNWHLGEHLKKCLGGYVKAVARSRSRRSPRRDRRVLHPGLQLNYKIVSVSSLSS